MVQSTYLHRRTQNLFNQPDQGLYIYYVILILGFLEGPNPYCHQLSYFVILSHHATDVTMSYLNALPPHPFTQDKTQSDLLDSSFQVKIIIMRLGTLLQDYFINIAKSQKAASCTSQRVVEQLSGNYQNISQFVFCHYLSFFTI